MAVLREAARQFCERGYAATQMSEVARQLGVTKPTIYYYFASKEDVLVACFETGLGQFQSGVEEGARTGRSGAERLRAALIRYGELLTQDVGRCAVLIHIADLGAESRARIVASRRQFDAQVRQLIDDAVADGSIRQCDCKIAAFTILGSLNWIAQWHRPDGLFSGGEAARRVVDELFSGFGLAPA